MPKPQTKPNMAEILSTQWDGRQSMRLAGMCSIQQHSACPKPSGSESDTQGCPLTSTHVPHTCAWAHRQIHRYTSHTHGVILKKRVSHHLQRGMHTSRILRQMSFLTWIIGVHTLCPITSRRWSSIQRHFECSYRIIVSWAFPRLKQCGFPIAC